MDVIIEESPVLLVIDDEEEVLAAIKSLLRKIKITQYYFTSPSEAIRFMQNNKVDLILTDMKMPEISGRELLIEAKKYQPDAIKFMLSAHENKKEILDTLALGLASYYLFKPWDDFEFINLIEKYTNYYEKEGLKEVINYISSFSRFLLSGAQDKNLLAMLENENLNINTLCTEIEKNPFLAAKLIQISNSVSFGAARSITSIKSAVLFIGLRHLKNLLISLSVLKKFTEIIHPVYHDVIYEYWNRTNKRAKIASQISAEWHVKVDTDLLFISTVLTDIGELYFLYTNAEKYKQYVEFVQTTNISRIEAEEKFFIYSHTYVGGVLLNVWNFPEEIVSIVENHHKAEVDNEIVRIIQLCDIIEEQGLSFKENFNMSEYVKNFNQAVV